MKSPKSGSANNIVYVDYSNSSLDLGYIPDVNVPDNFSNLIKNSTIIIKEVYPIQKKLEKINEMIMLKKDESKL